MAEKITVFLSSSDLANYEAGGTTLAISREGVAIYPYMGIELTVPYEQLQESSMDRRNGITYYRYKIRKGPQLLGKEG